MPIDLHELDELNEGIPQGVYHGPTSVNMPVIDAKIFWREVPGYVDEYFEMQEHTDFPTLQPRYRIITSGRRDYKISASGNVTDPTSGVGGSLKVERGWKVKVAKAGTFGEIKRDWDTLHRFTR